MSGASIFRWHEHNLVPLDYCDMTDTTVVAADSWLVTEGSTLALSLHRERFFSAVAGAGFSGLGLEEFWDSAIEAIPREGDWFPRVELQSRSGAPLLLLRLRDAPPRSASVVVASVEGPDPRAHPLVKGPDLETLSSVRTAAQARGAGEAVILSRDGFVVEGAFSGMLWWRGDILCTPPDDFPRIDSVTVRSVLALAAALGVETWQEAVTPAELEGTELWVLSALHGPRIVTEWIDGPKLAELPGRLGVWRGRLEALRRPT